MKSFKILAISLLMVSASAIVAAEPVPVVANEPAPKGYLTTAKEYTYDVAKKYTWDIAKKEYDNGWQGKALVGAGVVLGAYGLTKVSDTVKAGWNKARFNVVSDKIESTVEEAKNNPKSTEGVIVGASALALIYGGLVKGGYVSSPFKGSAPVAK